VPFTYKKGAKMGQGGTFIKWEWGFAVSGGEYEGLEVRGNSEPRVTSADMTSGSLKLASLRSRSCSSVGLEPTTYRVDEEGRRFALVASSVRLRFS
jgi:hypothetical protein